MADAAAYHTSKHLSDAELGSPQGNCLFCGSEDRVLAARLQTEPTVDLLECRSCGLCSASRVPTAEALQHYYGGYYERSSSVGLEDSQVTFGNINRFAGHLLKIIDGELAEGPLSILDFGGGDGTISLQLAEKLVASGHPSISITVIEYHDQIVQSTNPQITLRHFSTMDALADETGSYDIVLASAIIEHLADAKAESERLLSFLRPSGILYVRTPYMVPLLRLMKRFGLTLDFTFPGHIHDMGQVFWEGYFAGLEPKGAYRILRSQPSIVETSFRTHFLRTCASYLLKLPWKLLGRRYTLVGGWEIFVQKAKSS